MTDAIGSLEPGEGSRGDWLHGGDHVVRTERYRNIWSEQKGRPQNTVRLEGCVPLVELPL